GLVLAWVVAFGASACIQVKVSSESESYAEGGGSKSGANVDIENENESRNSNKNENENEVDFESGVEGTIYADVDHSSHSHSGVVCCTGEDRDGDRHPDRCDKCPGHYDADQRDSDNDGVGDACDNCR